MGTCRPLTDSEADAMEAHCHGPQEGLVNLLLSPAPYDILRS
jgi:hypothetical protein